MDSRSLIGPIPLQATTGLSQWLCRNTSCSSTATCCSFPGFLWNNSAFRCLPRRFCWRLVRFPLRMNSVSPSPCWPDWSPRSMADSAWFLIGRRYGHHVLRILCKLSLEPTTCVRRTQDSFGRRRAITLMIAKFVPGLSTLAPPVAGQYGMGFWPFLLFDGIGALAWVGALLAAGRFFGDLLKRNPGLFELGGQVLRCPAGPGHFGLSGRPHRPPAHGD